MKTNLIKLGLDLLLRKNTGGSTGTANPYAGHPLLNQPEYRRHLFHRGKARPILLICETVNICNNDCIVCPYGIMERKKAIMPLPLFQKVLSDYAGMGGGALSLTPMVGEIFLDKYLHQRVELASRQRAITGLSFTTNATHADRFARDELRLILKRLTRVHISVYGLDREEHLALARRDDYERVLGSIRTIIDACDDRDKVVFGFRTLKKYDDATVKAWIRNNFGGDFAVSSVVHRYANWGATFDAASHRLPFDGEWLPVLENAEPCLIPLIACQVYVNGDVSFSHCCDYDALGDFALGNVKDQPLKEIFNGPRARRLWDSMAGGCLPDYCRNCTFHIPMRTLPGHAYVFEDPYRLIGG